MVKYYINNELVEDIRFPITTINEKSTLNVIVENEYYEDVELIPFTGDLEVSIKSYPKRLQPKERGNSVWVFAPTEKRLKNVEGMPAQVSLKTKCGFKELIG